jgi:hypothetical protein
MSRAVRRPVHADTELHHIVTWVGGGCGLAGAAGGFFVGYAYTLDQGDPAFAPFTGAFGLVVGVLLGLLSAIAPILVLAAINLQRWAAATALRSVLASAAAAAPAGGVNLVLGASPAWHILCTGVTGVPAAIATLCLDWRMASRSRRAFAGSAV